MAATVELPVAGDELCRKLLENIHDAVCVTDLECRIVCWNQAAEALTGYRPEQVLGKFRNEAFLLLFEETNNGIRSGFCSAADTLKDEQNRRQRVYLRHKSGHLVPTDLRTVVLHDNLGKMTGVLEIMPANNEPRAEECTESAISLADGTPLPGKRYLLKRLHARFNERKRYGGNFGVILAELDRYGLLADQYGRQAADRMFAAAARTFANSLRSYDVMGHWDANKLLAIVPVLNSSDLHTIGERVRQLTEQTVLFGGTTLLSSTISIGAVDAHKNDSPETLLDRANLWLAKSKAGGGNKVSL